MDDDWIKSAWTGIQPDGYIFLSDGATELVALIEVELTSKVDGALPSAFAKKVPKYLDLLHEHSFPFPPIVFTFAKTRARAESLRKATMKAGGRSNFWFGTIEMLADPVTFFDAEFLVATADPRTINDKLCQTL